MNTTEILEKMLDYLSCTTITNILPEDMGYEIEKEIERINVKEIEYRNSADIGVSLVEEESIAEPLTADEKEILHIYAVLRYRYKCFLRQSIINTQDPQALIGLYNGV